MRLSVGTTNVTATDGKDGKGSKLEKIEPYFSCFDAMSSKITNKYIMVTSP